MTVLETTYARMFVKGLAFVM
jgi:hypothetical protein